jgi:hypothetical protein
MHITQLLYVVHVRTIQETIHILPHMIKVYPNLVVIMVHYYIVTDRDKENTPKLHYYTVFKAIWVRGVSTARSSTIRSAYIISNAPTISSALIVSSAVSIISPRTISGAIMSCTPSI